MRSVEETMSDEPRVYLAGPIQHASDHGRVWRTSVKRDYVDIEWVDPLDKYDVAVSDVEWSAKRVVREDKTLIDTCDAMLLRYEEVPQFGTPREYEYAVQQDIPIFVQTDADEASVWASSDAEIVADTFDEAVDAIKEHVAVTPPTP